MYEGEVGAVKVHAMRALRITVPREPRASDLHVPVLGDLGVPEQVRIERGGIGRQVAAERRGFRAGPLPGKDLADDLDVLVADELRGDHVAQR